MANLTKTNWSLGWNPSSDRINGNPEGLLRMDNLMQESSGAISVVTGRNQINSGGPDVVYSMYSTVLGNRNPVYATYGKSGRSVVRSKSGNFDDTTTIVDSGGGLTAYGTALGEVFVINGGEAKKDDGSTIRNLGLKDQLTGPAVAIQAPALLDISSGSWTVIEGVNPVINPNGGNGVQIYLDPTTLRANVLLTFSSTKDTTAFGDGVTDSFLTDIVSFLAQIHDSSGVTSIRMQVILDDDPTQPLNYYWNEFDIDSGQFNLGVDQQSIPGCQRQLFTRQGGDSSLDWKHVTAIQFVFTGTAYTWVLVDQGTITGGPQGNLLGVYQYLTVAVFDNGIYQAKSAVSPFTNNILVQNSFTNVTLTATDTTANQVWVFRKSMISSTDPIYQTFIQGSKIPASLNDFYFVGQGAPGAIFKDNTSDIEALQINITANQFLQSIQDLIAFDPIIGMEGLYYERMLYVSNTSIYLSDPLNPDAVDTRYTIKAFSTNTEKNLWLKKISPSQLVLATTHDNYLITGTLETLPDGSVDVTIAPIGEKYPALCSSVCNVNGNLFYAAADGIRVTNGSGSTSISQQLRLLWAGETRHELSGVLVDTQNNQNYSIAAGKTKIYVTVPLIDGSSVLYVYDTQLQNWRFVDNGQNPTCVLVDGLDRVLVGYGPQFGIVIIDNGQPDASGWPIEFRTVYDANQQPRNRKDTFTLKINADTGGMPVNVFVAIDGGGWTQVGTITSSGESTSYFPMDGHTLGFRYAFKLTDVNLVKVFTLYELTLEYEPRPEQLDYLRVLPTNLGTVSRKRFTAYAFVIDTLGNTINFTPFVDNTAQTGLSFSTGTKLTQIVYFTAETVGTDIGGVFSGGIFEFYQVAIEECVSEKLPTPVKFLVIPSNNYGTPNRKRFTSVKFQILTRGHDVTYTPIIDGTSFPTAIFNTTTKRTVEYFFPEQDISGLDLGGTLSGSQPFEFYGLIVPQQVEQLPDRLTYFVIPQNNYGSPNRKRFSSIKFEINTNGQDVLYTPQVDNDTLDPQIINTVFKRTVFVYFNGFDLSGVDIGGTLASQTSTPFEFYQVIRPQEVEEIPALLEYFLIPPANYGTPNRKRLSSFKFQINTFGHFCSFTPLVDRLPGSPLIFKTFVKETIEYFYTSDTVGIDFAGIVQSTETPAFPFEFYEVITPQTVEKLPDRLEFFLIPPSDYGVPNRKRHSSYKFQINTNGQPVQFTPIIDMVRLTPTSYTTASKQTVEYFFKSDTVGIDVGGELAIQGTQPFEFYGTVVPQTVEKLPDRLEFFKSTNTNFGVAARKRVRTFPIEIDTYGQPVTFTPIVDGVLQSVTTTLISTGKTTLYHFFGNDVFGTDYGGTFLSQTNQPFEFYGYGQPEDVETLPVPKIFDQLGPARFDKIGKFFGFRLRLIMNGLTTLLPFKFYGDLSPTTPANSNLLFQGNLAVTPGIDGIYEIQLPKSVNTDILRLVLGPTVDSFHRYDCHVKVQTSGMESDAQWIRMR